MKIYKNFISFEGIDFSGKTTQIKMLLERLKSYKIHPLVVREPGGTRISEKIREILLNPLHSEMFEKTEILLYEAARAQVVHEVIISYLQEGKYIIVDRFFDSTTAYQGYGRELEIKFVQRLNNFATSNLKPYKTFFIDISPKEAESRQIKYNHSQDRLEGTGIEFFIKIRNGFLKLCEEEPERFIRINGERAPDEIAGDIWKSLRKIWPLSKVEKK